MGSGQLPISTFTAGTPLAYRMTTEMAILKQAEYVQSCLTWGIIFIKIVGYTSLGTAGLQY